jgi:hypothetical protein
MKKQKYLEEHKARERFERTVSALFQVKKATLAEKIKKKTEKGKD